ncbi:hypothetical protein FOXG_18363 [Fusarium oxysporum f. sp. lycopersici 4287]|uniref:Fungal N-terminal domain-containing protein n=1 Tax=Fusarium oxysporum f. sp. lycopersici (strain 4287 / CBS 123668 / FGSC 9935 / NRRL 34936) TaxID=426428 RepID=A0A0J9UGI9_FUSO4|nr:hypothetical protein FOXG_18363 [Fusarium oxysporum f. sp. lycopersici 4287]KAJ9425932.1 hypothetical protein QL093DRAFT_2057591 [Fusarium oxysporum]KNA98234.1 hypothetical protein FOXG_18363 [Fusarium oxysporum f. sp. lycopersici 4287]
MDGLSVAASCVALIQASDKTFVIVSQFIRDCKDAKNDLVSVNQELSALRQTLGLLQDLVPDDCDFVDSDVTKNTKNNINEIITSSLNVARDIDGVLSGHKGKLAAVNWATSGKRKISGFKASLETNRRALNLAVDVITYAASKDIKNNTINILDDTTHIKGGVSSIEARIRNLEAKIEGSYLPGPHSYMLKNYLNDISSVAGSVFGTSSRPASPEVETSQITDCGDRSAESEDLAYFDAIWQDPTPDEANTPGKQPASLVKATPMANRVTLAGNSDVDSHSQDQKSADIISMPFPNFLARIKSRPYVSQQRQSLPVELDHRSSEFRSCMLPSDGATLLWKADKRPFRTYDIRSGEVAEHPLPTIDPTDHLLGPTWFSELEVLSADASLLMVRQTPRHRHWTIYDRRTGKTILPIQNQELWGHLSIVQISNNCSLLTLSDYDEGCWLVKVQRLDGPYGRQIIRSQYKQLLKSRGVTLFALSHSSQTVTALVDEYPPKILTWKLHRDCFVDKELDVLPEVQWPDEIRLKPKRAFHGYARGIASAGDTVVIMTETRAFDPDSHRRRTTAITVFGYDLLSGVMKFRHIFRNSKVPRDGSPSSARRVFYTDGKISADGKLLMITRAKEVAVDKKEPSNAETSSSQERRFTTETKILQIEGMHLVHRFENNPSHRCIFSPNFDKFARLEKDPKSGEDIPRTFLTIYIHKASLEN